MWGNGPFFNMYNPILINMLTSQTSPVLQKVPLCPLQVNTPPPKILTFILMDPFYLLLNFKTK